MKSTIIGILSAISASICCTIPLLLTVLGFGSLGLGAVTGKYHWVFLTTGAILILFSWLRYFREKKRCGGKECQMRNKKITLITLIITTIIVLSFIGLGLYSCTEAEGLTCPACDTSETADVNQVVPAAGYVTSPHTCAGSNQN